MIDGRQLAARADDLLARAASEGWEPFGWIAHSDVFHALRRAFPEEPAMNILYFRKYRLFFSDELAPGTLELLFDRPADELGYRAPNPRDTSPIQKD